MQSALTGYPPPGIETEVRRIAALMGGGEFAQVVAAADALLRDEPRNRDLLYLLAAAQRRLQRIPEALAALERLETHHPSFSRLFEERGFCALALRAAPRALESFEHAVALNNCLLETWRALEALYRLGGRAVEAQSAAAQAAHLASLPADIRSACALFFDGERVLAEELVRRHLSAHGEHVEALRLLARMAADAGAELDAQALLARAVALDPSHPAARYEYAVALLNRQKHAAARVEAQRLLADAPTDARYRALLAAAAAGLGDYGVALPLYRALAAESPTEARVEIALGNALKTQGQTAEAIEAYRRAAAAPQDFGEAYWSLANLKTYRFSDAEVGAMQRAEANGATSAGDRFHLCFALGKALEDRGEFAASFELYSRGNALKRSTLRYRPESLERRARLQAALCTRDFFESRRGHGLADCAPIFIVGLPRSGSTLIEQILASHSQVEGTFELPDIPRILQELEASARAAATAGYPQLLADLSAEACAGLGAVYLEGTRAYRSGKPRFLDKMPNNFRHIDLIHLLLPNAKILDVRREPLACCFGIFKQLFAAGQKFAYSVEDIARYYRMYVELMAHWDDALPGKILHIHYEDVVDDLDSSVRRILDFCGLDFERGCLEFYKTRRSVHSASSEQVHLPIYREGLDQWRRYEPWLDPLKRALEPMMAHPRASDRA